MEGEGGKAGGGYPASGAQSATAKALPKAVGSDIGGIPGSSNANGGGCVPPPSPPIYFTGEMVYEWMFEGDYSQLTSLRECANLLAQKEDWPVLYDVSSLRHCKVPCAAAVYYEDMYVETAFSEETGRLLPNCKMWITNEYQHSGLQDDGYNITAKLLNMVRGGLQIPS